ncbi:MAG: phosphoribosylanthranilate isomerase [Halanaerobiales bacterium]
MRVKVCGLTRKEDVEICDSLGVDALGFILAESPRRVEIEDVAFLTEDISPFICRVVVVMNPDNDLLDKIVSSKLFDYIQFHGNEDPEIIKKCPLKKIKSISISINKCKHDRYLIDINKEIDKYDDADFFLFDTKSGKSKGGTGKSFNWSIFKSLDIRKPFILAGGLGIDNIESALNIEGLSGVDLNSKLESAPGIKDKEKLYKVMENIKRGRNKVMDIIK